MYILIIILYGIVVYFYHYFIKHSYYFMLIGNKTNSYYLAQLRHIIKNHKKGNKE